MPRRYRGRDILDWMDRCGILDQSYEDVEDLARGRRLPSSQLVGSNDKAILDLNSLREQGVRIAGRLMGINGDVAQFSGSLRNVCALADLKMKRLLSAIDEFVADEDDVPAAESFADTIVDDSPLLMKKARRRVHRYDYLGDRLQARLQLARRACARPQGPYPARRRRRRRSRSVRAWTAADARTQVELHLRH